jgi:hypothetical protein
MFALPERTLGCTIVPTTSWRLKRTITQRPLNGDVLVVGLDHNLLFDIWTLALTSNIGCHDNILAIPYDNLLLNLRIPVLGVRNARDQSQIVKLH